MPCMLVLRPMGRNQPMTYELLKFTHLVGLALISGGLIGV